MRVSVLSEEIAPFGQAGQAIGVGQTRVVLRELARLRLRCDELDEGLEVAVEDADHDHGHEGRVDGDRKEDVIETRDAEEQEDAHHDAGHEKSGNGQVCQAEDASNHGYGNEDRHMALLIGSTVAVQDHRPAHEGG
jgi:hypothetical protein